MRSAASRAPRQAHPVAALPSVFSGALVASPATRLLSEEGDGVELPPKETSMEQATTIGLDIAKHVFQLHGADTTGHVLFRKRTRTKLLGFLAAQTRCVVAM